MRGVLAGLAAAVAVTVLGFSPCRAASPPSRFGVDAPQLAPLGAFPVGVRSLTLVQRNQEDVLAWDAGRNSAPKTNRELVVDVWYPAQVPEGAHPETYSASLPSEPPDPAAAFTVPGIAVRDAPQAGRDLPLVIVSHGYSNWPVAMTWLTENLASKGYVVAAIRHDDPPITDRTRYPQVLLRRPIDVAYVSQQLGTLLGHQHLVNASRVALVGYSMGGYGVLTAGGATLDPASPAVARVPGRLLAQYARGGARRDSLNVPGLRAIVAMAPAGGGPLAAWGSDGLRDIREPLLLIAGDADRTLDYNTGAHAIYEGATHAVRYLLTLKGCGHSIGLNPVPDAMRGRLWNQDWFEDPVWRKERINAISAHFITAFLDRYLKGDVSRDAFLDVPVTESAAGTWTNTEGFAYDAYSPGSGGISVWKGFQRNHAAGLELLKAQPAP